MKITLTELRQIVKSAIKEEKKSIKQENLIDKLQGNIAALGARIKTDKNNAQIQKYSTEVRNTYFNIGNGLRNGGLALARFKSALSTLEVNRAPEYKQQIDALNAAANEYEAAINALSNAGLKFYNLVGEMQRSANAQGVANKQAATTQTTTATGNVQAK